VVACISPWNFPVAIFTGQIAAALAAGNSVNAKPARQTPLCGALVVGTVSEAGAAARCDVAVHLALERVAPGVSLVVRDSVGFRLGAVAQHCDVKRPEASEDRGPYDPAMPVEPKPNDLPDLKCMHRDLHGLALACAQGRVSA
jgi:hypothetical protein